MLFFRLNLIVGELLAVLCSILERVLLEVGQGVLEPDVQGGDPGQGILRTWPT